jgi:hypothetical protein
MIRRDEIDASVSSTLRAPEDAGRSPPISPLPGSKSNAKMAYRTSVWHDLIVRTPPDPVRRLDLVVYAGDPPIRIESVHAPVALRTGRTWDAGETVVALEHG